MANHATFSRSRVEPLSPDSLKEMPIFFEDDEEGDMGESNLHTATDEIIRSGLKAHLVGRSEYQVFSVLDAAAGRGYVRPLEAEKRARDLEAEIERLRQALIRDKGA